MANRMKDMGMDRALGSKILSKYDINMEAEVLGWIQELTGTTINPGPDNVQQQLRDGVVLVKLIKAVYEGTPNLPPAAAALKSRVKPNKAVTSFDQMENIEIFSKAAEAYGVPQNGLFPTIDLFENKNMSFVLASISLLGTEAQRNGFQGKTIGAKPVDKVKRNFSLEQLRAGEGHVSLQAGTNQFASQKGMRIGATRHVADLPVEKQAQEGQGVIGLQCGTNRFASQKGMKIGGVRHIADIKCDDMSQEGQGHISLQSGTNQFASQKGMRIGATRHVSDIHVDKQAQEAQGVIGLQSGTNQFASQKGMRIGATRHVADIKVLSMAQEAQGLISLQSGTNQFANQSGMNFGKGRGVADIKTVSPLQEGLAAMHATDGHHRYHAHEASNGGEGVAAEVAAEAPADVSAIEGETAAADDGVSA